MEVQGLAVAKPRPWLVASGCKALTLPNDPAPEVDQRVFFLAATYGTRAQLAALLKVEPEAVAALEETRQLFSILDASRSQPLYGLFQGLEGVAGKPLSQVLGTFYRAIDAGIAFMGNRDIASFFRTPTRVLAWTTPLEVLLGHRLYDVMPDPEASWLMLQPDQFRLGAVLGAVKDELQHRRT